MMKGDYVILVLGLLALSTVLAKSRTDADYEQVLHDDPKECECGPGSKSCEWENQLKICHCKDGYSQNNETCEECECGKGATKCYFEEGKKTCECRDGYYVKDKQCAECDCGPESKGCKWENQLKICNCNEGYSQNNETCEKCECGKGSTKCYFEEGNKTCECRDGYYVKDEQCADCGCGEDSYGCELVNGLKICNCSDGYSQRNGFCEECKCGKGATKCFFEKGNQRCECQVGYAEKDEQCKVCSCGNSSSGCHFEGEKKICHCFPGYYDKEGNCEDCECSSNSNGCDLVDGVKICNCSAGYSQNETYCEKCDCGRGADNCYFEERNKVCNCKDGYYLRDRDGQCAEDLCLKKPCKNEGICTNIKDDFECECVGYFGGKDCTENKWCEMYGNDMCDKVPCTYDDALQEGYCVCNASQWFDETKKICKSIDPCIPKLLGGECSKPHETCESGKCRCKVNYNYTENEDSCIANFCETKKQCPPFSECTDKKGGNVQCVCKEGFYRKDGNCEKVDFCLLSGCSQNCSEGKCACVADFELSEDNKNCTSTNATCDRDCGAGTCVKRGDQKVCVCPESTHTFVNETCRDICSAKGKAPKNLCPTEECEPTTEGIGFRCVCNGTYKHAEDGVRCERKVMCEEEEAKTACEKKRAICKEIPRDDLKGYECICDKGYEMDGDVCRKKCDIIKYKDQCSQNSAVCDLDEEYNVVCRCPPKLTKTSSGKCSKVAAVSYLGKLNVFKKNYEVHDSGTGQSESLDVPKLVKDLKDSIGGVQKFEDFKLLGFRIEKDFIDCRVELQLSEEPTTNLNKIKNPKFCIPVLGSDYCLVRPNLLLKPSKEDIFKNASLCDEEIKTKLCGEDTKCSESPSFRCTCKEGFETVGVYNPLESPGAYIEVCNDIDECRVPAACPDTTDCRNTHGSYECRCPKGYSRIAGKDPKTDGCKPFCEPNPCDHGDCAVYENNQWFCNCHKNWTGIVCNTSVEVIKIKEDKNLASAGGTTTAIVGGVLGALLAVVLIAFIAVLVKKNKGGLDEEDYVAQQHQGVRSQMSRMAQRRHYQDEEQEVELRGERDNAERKRESRQERMLPRAQITRRSDERPRYSGSETTYKNSAYVGD